MFFIKIAGRRNRLVLAVLSLLLIGLFYAFLRIPRPPPLDTYVPPPKFKWRVDENELQVTDKNDLTNTVHIALSVKGKSYFSQMTTMLKSMLYYANRFKSNVDKCTELIESQSNPMCPLSTGPMHTFPIHVHVLCNLETCSTVETALSGFKLKDFRWSIYPSEAYAQQIRWIPNPHYAGTQGFLKLVLHDIIPENVTKVIYLDTDLVFNYNVVELWKLFDKFNRDQALGMAVEFYASDEDCHTKLPDILKNYGVNSGLILLQLDKMRKYDWSVLWHEEVFYILSKHSKLPMGDQSVYDYIIDHNPNIFYQVPCEWNFQIVRHSSTHCCPSVWPDRQPNEEDCVSQSDSPGTLATRNVVNFNELPKPGEKDLRYLAYKRGGGMMPDLTYKSMKKKFLKAYYQFNDIPAECFQ